MKVVTGKGAAKPSDLFISTAISFKKCLSRLLLLQSRNMTAHCRSEINPKASEAAGNNSLQRCSHHPPSPCLSQPALENIESTENDVCFSVFVSILSALLLNAPFSTSSLGPAIRDSLFSSPSKATSLQLHLL